MNCAVLLRALRDNRLTRTDLAVLGILLRESETPATRREIAQEAGCAASSVPRSARKLEELGYVLRVIDARDHGGRAKPTRYRLASDTYQDGYASNAVRTEPEPPQIVVEPPKRTQNPVARSRPDTSKIPPKEYNQTPQEFYPERSELVEVVVVAANSDRPPPPLWQRVLDAVRSPWLDENKNQQLILESYVVEGWARDGADEHLDIIPTVRRLIERKRTPVPWGYFTRAVREAAAKRIAASKAQPIQPAEIIHDHASGATFADPGIRRRERSPLTDLAMRLMAEG